MNRLFYHWAYPQVWMVVLSTTKIEKYEQLGNVVVLKSQDVTTGYNLLAMPELSSGYHPLVAEKLDLVNEQLIKVGLPSLNQEINPIVAGRIEELQAISKGVWLARIAIGKKTIPVVTKATNVYSGQMVAVALPGAVLYNGVIIDEGEVFGHRSCGVLVSRSSLFGEDNPRDEIIELGSEVESETIVTEKTIYGTE